MKNQRKELTMWSKKFGLVCIILFSMSTILAQTDHTKQVSQTKLKQENEKKEIVVKGNVSDDTGGLPDVNIVLEGTAIGTTTNLKGDFEFPKKLKKGDVLVFSYLGMESQKVVINNSNSASNVGLKLDMVLTPVTLLGSASSNKVYKSKRK